MRSSRFALAPGLLLSIAVTAWADDAQRSRPPSIVFIMADDMGICTMLDRNVGEILDRLDKLDIAEQTIVFLCSDSGAAERFEGTLDSCGPRFPPRHQPEPEMPAGKSCP